MANTKISALTDGAPATASDVFVIERSSTNNFRLAGSDIKTFVSASPTLVTPALGTPSSGTLSSCTGYAQSALTGLGTGISTWLGTPSSANLATAVTDETGSGALVFGTAPTISSPAITGTPTFITRATLTAQSASITNSEVIFLQTGAIGAARLAVGSVVRVWMSGICSSGASPGTPTFRIRVGPLGTTSDPAPLTATLGAAATTGTNIPFNCWATFTVRATGSGTSATCYSNFQIINAGTTGIATAQASFAAATNAGYDTTTNNIISVSLIFSTANTSALMQQCIIEVYN